MTSGSGIPRQFLALLAIQATFLYASIATGDVPFGEDQDAYLAAAHVVREGGILFDGQRHPLLPIVLAVLAPSGEDGYTASRLIVALGLGLMTLGQFLWARHLWGGGLAFLWAWFLGFNHLVLSFGSMVMVEAWLVHLLGFTLLALIQAQRLRRLWWLAGIFLGLAYLAKGTVPVVALAVFLALLVMGRVKAAGGVALGFLPWVGLFCVYRRQTFGDAWHQVSQRISWLDYYHPHQLSGSGFVEELAKVGWDGFALRITSGFCQLSSLVPAVFSPLRGGWTTLVLLLSVLAGIPLMRLYFQRGWKALVPARTWRLLPVMVGLWGLLILLFCAWLVPVAKVPRYGAPLIPLAALALVHLWKTSKPHTRLPELPWRRSWIWVGATALLLPWPGATWGDLADPDASWKKDERYKAYQLIRQAVEVRVPTRRPCILYGPGQVLPREWLWDFQRARLPYDGQDKATAVARAFALSDYWVIDRGTRERNGELFEKACEEVSLHGNLILSIKEIQGGVEVFRRR